MNDRDKRKDQMLDELNMRRGRPAEYDHHEAGLTGLEVTCRHIVGACDLLLSMSSRNDDPEFMNDRFIERTGRNFPGCRYAHTRKHVRVRFWTDATPVGLNDETTPRTCR
jgi:hypothetical protein